MMRLCIASQTPPAQPLPGAPTTEGATWKLGVDYVPQVGGVVPMMRALLASTRGRWVAPEPLWVALGDPSLPRRFKTDEGYTVETIDLSPAVRSQYVRFKEAVWRSFHGPWGLGSFPTATYQAYVDFNHRMAQRLLEHLDSYDLIYVHDYQLLLVGGLVGAAAPAVLRWHIPLELRGYPEQVSRFFLRAMEGFDAIVVSTRVALEELIHYGFHGRAYQVYPYVDPAEQGPVPASAVRRFRDKFGLGDHPYLLSVGRMDPVKRQDLLLRAFGRVRRRFPEHRLVLAGGSSFSTRLSSRSGGSPKDVVWSRRLGGEIRAAHLEDRVILTGRMPGEELRAAYQGAVGLVHPAPWEGFGLVGVEAWLHGLPIIVSRGAGISELVVDGVNGFVVPPGSTDGLAARMTRVLASPRRAEQMGEVGRLTARQCTVQVATRRLRGIFGRVQRTYRREGRTPPAFLGA